MVQRGEWEDLRQRLERLPAGHPSSPDDDGDAAEAGADAARTEDGRVGDPGADQGSTGQGRDEHADRDGRLGPDRRAGPDEHGGPGRRYAGPTLGPEQREPYRPWFSSGDWPDPWFAPDPDA